MCKVPHNQFILVSSLIVVGVAYSHRLPFSESRLLELLLLFLLLWGGLDLLLLFFGAFDLDASPNGEITNCRQLLLNLSEKFLPNLIWFCWWVLCKYSIQNINCKSFHFQVVFGGLDCPEKNIDFHNCLILSWGKGTIVYTLSSDWVQNKPNHPKHWPPCRNVETGQRRPLFLWYYTPQSLGNTSMFLPDQQTLSMEEDTF